MENPTITIDSYRETQITDSRKVRHYSRDEEDVSAPNLVEFYSKGTHYEAIDPIIANGIVLDKKANTYIDAVKAAKGSSYFVVFTKNGDPDAEKYLSVIPSGKDIDSVLKRIVENGATVLSYDTIEDFVGYYTEPEKEYSQLQVIVDVQTTKTTVLYVDEGLPLKCFISWQKGENDWYAYKYTWNLSDKNVDSIIVWSDGSYSLTATCSVEFRLRDYPDDETRAITKTASTMFHLQKVPDPEDLSITVNVTCLEGVEKLDVDTTYTLSASLQNNSLSQITDWELEGIAWNLTNPDDSSSTISFTPTEEKTYKIVAVATYYYKRDDTVKQSFAGELEISAQYPGIAGDIELETIDLVGGVILVGDYVSIQATQKNLVNSQYWSFAGYTWENADLSEDFNDIGLFFANTNDTVTVKCKATFILASDGSRSRSISGTIDITPKVLPNMYCTVNIDCSSDTIHVGDTLNLEAQILNAVNTSDWQLVDYVWRNALPDEFNRKNAVYTATEVGDVDVECDFVVEDKYSRGKILTFFGSRTIKVES